MANPMTIRVTESLREELNKISGEKGISVNQLISDVLRVGLIIEKNTDSESKVLITKPKDNRDLTILVPTK